MNKKYAVIENGRVSRVVLCKDPSLIVTAENNRIVEVEGKIRKGTAWEEEKQILIVEKRFNRAWIVAGATIASAIAAAAYYFLIYKGV